MQEKEILTYRSLKKILENFDETQLDLPVRWVGDGASGIINGMWIVEEDQINPSGDGWEPVSTYDNDPDFDASDEAVVCEKGSPMLLSN